MYEKISTRDMNREMWLELRRSGIGGSDAGALCQLSPYSNPMKVFQDKMGTCIESVEKESLKLGNDLEEYVARRFTAETGLKVRRSNYMYRSKEYPWMIADVDRLLVGVDAGLECKTTNIMNKKAWENGAPLWYVMQCFHYMIVLGKKEWFIAVLIMGDSFKYYRIVWDDEIAKRLIRIEKDFWHNHVLTGICPPLDGSNVCDEILRQKYHTARTESQIKLIGFDEKLDKRNELAEEIIRLQKEQKKIDQEIQNYMQDNELAISEKYKVLWGNVETTRFDAKRFKVENPELYQEYATSSISRRFQIKAA